MNTVLVRSGLSVSRIGPSPASRPQPLFRPRHRFRTQPLSVSGSSARSVESMLETRCGVWASPLTRRLADRISRNGFVILRAADSPPVALHTASRRRSYIRLQAGERMPEEDFHLSDQDALSGAPIVADATEMAFISGPCVKTHG